MQSSLSIPSAMKSHRPKLKTAARPLFSCGFFRHCTQTVTSPTTSNPPPLPQSTPHSDHPPPPAASSSPLPQKPSLPESSSSSNSSSTTTSQSFTQWKFPLPTSPITHHSSLPPPRRHSPSPPPPLPVLSANLQELYHVAELHLTSESDPADRMMALNMLERSLVPDPRAADVICPPAVMGAVVGYLGGTNAAGAKPATKVLLALCLAEGNRRVAVEAGAVGRVVEALADLEGPAAERALAALELLCTVAEGAAEVRAHALAVPMMVEVMGNMSGRGKEYAISVLAVIYSGLGEGLPAPPEAVARAVALALHGECSARGKRKGAQLLKILEESGGLDLTQDQERT